MRELLIFVLIDEEIQSLLLFPFICVVLQLNLHNKMEIIGTYMDTKICVKYN